MADTTELLIEINNLRDKNNYLSDKLLISEERISDLELRRI